VISFRLQFRLRSLYVLTAIVSVGGVLGPAIATASGETRESVGDQVTAAEREFIDKQQAIARRYGGTKSKEQQQQAEDAYQAVRSEFLAKCAAIVEKHADDAAVLPALRWMLHSPQHAAKAIDVLIEHDLQNEELGAICLQLGAHDAPGAETLARAVSKGSKSDDARALALLTLGQALFAKSDRDDIDAGEQERLRSQAAGLLETVIARYPDVDAMGRRSSDWANAVLFERRRLTVGQELPALAGDSLDGEPIKLSDYRGRVVLLVFWAHWSAGCVASIPFQRSLVERLAGKPFALVGVNDDGADGDLDRTNHERAINWPSLQNQRDGLQTIADEWNVRHWPTAYLIDHRGIIRGKWFDLEHRDAIDREIDRLVERAESMP
jgi:peroxiredoxin